MNDFCSPANENNKYCLSIQSLKKMVTIWNLFNKRKIPLTANATDASLYNALNKVMKPIGATNKFWLWPGIIERLAESAQVPNIIKIKRDLKKLAKKDLKPEKPESWYRNPKTWLSNYDIQNVMVQYEQNKKYKYRFLGVFPIDFSVVSIDGVCLYSEFCTIDVTKHANKGIKFIGLITNLDKHDESGSHWTSSFMVIDPNLKTYGAYYYDSTGNEMPQYLHEFLMKVKAQCDKMYADKTFVIYINKKQHQYKNTECGVFSMVFQIRWINKHYVKHNNTSFEEIISANPYIDDEHMLKIRDHLFRPNTKMELKKLKYFANQRQLGK